MPRKQLRTSTFLSEVKLDNEGEAGYGCSEHDVVSFQSDKKKAEPIKKDASCEKPS